MNPHAHFIGGILLGTLGFKLGFIQFYDILIIGIIAVLIDLDHYLFYILTERDLSPKRFWNMANNIKYAHKNIRMRSFIHHYNGMALIFPLLIIVLMLDIRIGYIGLSAYISHIILDHLKYFHLNIAPYKNTEIFGFKVMWNTTEEIFFIIMTMMSFMIIL